MPLRAGGVKGAANHHHAPMGGSTLNTKTAITLCVASIIPVVFLVSIKRLAIKPPMALLQTHAPTCSPVQQSTTHKHNSIQTIINHDKKKKEKKRIKSNTLTTNCWGQWCQGHSIASLLHTCQSTPKDRHQAHLGHLGSCWCRQYPLRRFRLSLAPSGRGWHPDRILAG